MTPRPFLFRTTDDPTASIMRDRRAGGLGMHGRVNGLADDVVASVVRFEATSIPRPASWAAVHLLDFLGKA